MSQVSFEGQVAIVTGGGRGLGRSYALEFARRGAAVVVNDLADGDGTSVADVVVAEIEEAGGRAAAAYGSVSEPGEARAVVETALERFGTVDVLVNNAGVMRNGWLEELTPEKWDAVVDVSVRGSFLVSQAVWPVFREKGYGRVLMISSSGGLFAYGGISNYAAAKAGLYGVMKALAYEGAEHGVRVNAILPYGEPMASMDIVPPGHQRDYPEGLEGLAPLRTNKVVVSLATLLSSRVCPVNGEAFSVGYGRYARVFVGVTPGWIAPDDAAMSAEAVRDHFDEIRHLDGFIVPDNQYDELRAIAAALAEAG